MINKKTSKRILLTIIVFIISFIIFLPVLLAVFTSFKTMPEIQSNNFKILPEKFMFSNYIDAMKQGDWPRYFLNSFIVTGVTVAVSIWFNVLAGFSFARVKFRGSQVLFFLMLIGIMVPAQVTVIPVFSMMKNFPLAGGNNIFGNGGKGLLNTYTGLIIPFAAGSFGVFLCKQFFMNFPKALDEAAEIDGATKWQTFIKIYTPLSKPIVATLAITKSASSWNDYLWPLILTNTNNMRTVQLGLTMFRQETTTQWNYLMAATILVILPLVIIFLVAQKHYIGGITNSGLKG